MLTKQYTPPEIDTAISQLKNQKAHGIDGIPGEAYKALKNWIMHSLTEIIRKIQKGGKMPPEWKEGAIVHIYKKKMRHT